MIASIYEEQADIIGNAEWWQCVKEISSILESDAGRQNFVIRLARAVDIFVLRICSVQNTQC